MAIFIVLMMEALFTSETWIYFHGTTSQKAAVVV
jgi:hypothetical protein